jgi:hypothetical protein
MTKKDYTYKGYPITKIEGGYVVTIEDGMFSYSMLTYYKKTLSEAKKAINDYKLRISKNYN